MKRKSPNILYQGDEPWPGWRIARMFAHGVEVSVQGRTTILPYYQATGPA